MVASQAPPTHPPCRSSLCDSPMTHRHVCLHKPKREIWILMENIPMWMVMFLNCQSCTFSINCVYKYIRILCTLYRKVHQKGLFYGHRGVGGPLGSPTSVPRAFLTFLPLSWSVRRVAVSLSVVASLLQSARWLQVLPAAQAELSGPFGSSPSE